MHGHAIICAGGKRFLSRSIQAQLRQTQAAGSPPAKAPVGRGKYAPVTLDWPAPVPPMLGASPISGLRPPPLTIGSHHPPLGGIELPRPEVGAWEDAPVCLAANTGRTSPTDLQLSWADGGAAMTGPQAQAVAGAAAGSAAAPMSPGPRGSTDAQDSLVTHQQGSAVLRADAQPATQLPGGARAGGKGSGEDPTDEDDAWSPAVLKMMEDADVMAMNDADLEAALAGQGPPRLSEVGTRAGTGPHARDWVTKLVLQNTRCPCTQGLDLLPGMSPLESPGLHLDIGSLF